VTEYVVLETGNPQLATGSIAAHYEYDAFGNLIPNSSFLIPNCPDFRFRFSTKYLDSEIGNYSYILHPYSPYFDRFLSRDPIEKRGGLNLYAFCQNDPINKWDYLGMKSNDDICVRWETVHIMGGPPLNRCAEWKSASLHFKDLREKLRGELKDMCPSKATTWWVTPVNVKKCFVCDPEDCNKTAEALAETYIIALEDAYRVRRLPGGRLGNAVPAVVRFFDSDSRFGQIYPDHKTCLTCEGWETMASYVLTDLFNPDAPLKGRDNCWVYELKPNKAYTHQWATLRVMNGTPKELDPWPSGGWNYESDWTQGKKK
jgi:RHS repeat-associated protein